MGAKKLMKKGFSRWKYRTEFPFSRAKENRLAIRQADAVSEIVLSSKNPFVTNQPFIPCIEGDEQEEEKMMEIFRERNFDD